MSNAVAVIGGGYGDEGKGLMTDYWASKAQNPMVIRFNGGAQAGHGVQTPDGAHNVFSHFGSGTFVDAPTYLSKFFVVNPLLFKAEHESFVKKFNITPKIFVDYRCITTTPIEMIINQELEKMRQGNRHGSVGAGFGETLERVKRTQEFLQIGFMSTASYSDISEIMKGLIKNYMPKRLKSIPTFVNNKLLKQDYHDALKYFKQHTDITRLNQHNGDIVFEGAQGLELDQDYGVFPYVTRSNCGMRNVTELVQDLKLGFNELTVNYVTRAYKTRHGAGPLRHEYNNAFPYADLTNVYNEWQGAIRWGKFDYNEYRSITDKDFALYANQHNRNYSVTRIDTVTCMDQILEYEKSDMLRLFKDRHAFSAGVSFGPTRKNIEWLV